MRSLGSPGRQIDESLTNKLLFVVQLRVSTAERLFACRVRQGAGDLLNRWQRLWSPSSAVTAEGKKVDIIM